MRRVALLLPLLGLLACRPDGPATSEPSASPSPSDRSASRGEDEDRRYWPASLDQSTFHRVGPLPLGHPLADTAEEAECRQAIELAVAGTASKDEQVAALTDLHGRCPDGLGIAWRIAHLELESGDLDGGVDWTVREVAGEYPLVVQALQELGPVYEQLGDAHFERFADLGSTPERPMWLPSVDLQMGYIAAFVCRGDARPAGQALMDVDGRKMDRVEYECIGAGSGARYFFLPLMTAMGH